MIFDSILRKSLKNTGKHNRARVIAVSGVEKGVGVTHFSLLLAHCLVKLRLKVVLCECNSSGAYGRIQWAYEGVEPEHEGMFRAKGIDYHKSLSHDDYENICMEPYDVIIADMGNLDIRQYRSEFVRADESWLVGTYSDWKRHDYDAYIRDNADMLTKRCRLLVNYGDKEEVRTLGRHSGMSVFAMPFIKDPFVRSKEGRSFIHSLLGEI